MFSDLDLEPKLAGGQQCDVFIVLWCVCVCVRARMGSDMPFLSIRMNWVQGLVY